MASVDQAWRRVLRWQGSTRELHESLVSAVALEPPVAKRWLSSSAPGQVGPGTLPSGSAPVYSVVLGLFGKGVLGGA